MTTTLLVSGSTVDTHEVIGLPTVDIELDGWIGR